MVTKNRVGATAWVKFCAETVLADDDEIESTSLCERLMFDDLDDVRQFDAGIMTASARGQCGARATE